MTRIVGIIPARLESTRLPQKLLKRVDDGRSILQLTWEATKQAQMLNDVIIATDSGRIRLEAERFGASTVLTESHPNGTSRLAEVAYSFEPDTVIVNIQGDHPGVNPAHIDDLVRSCLRCGLKRAMEGMWTAATPDIGRYSDDVWVSMNGDGRALYFSRQCISQYRHIGLYCYTKAFLDRYTNAGISPLELNESLEQMRAIWHGWPIYVRLVESSHRPIDTQEGFDHFCRVHQLIAGTRRDYESKGRE